jgi:hypothetical protein
LVTAHNGPQVTIDYKRGQLAGLLEALLRRRLDERRVSDDHECYGLRVAVEGVSVELQAHVEHVRQGGGIRGEIKGFSRQSRARFMHQIGSINRQVYDHRRVLFMTLTYHRSWSEDPAEQYGQLRKWFKRMNRRWPGTVIQWRKEWQARGAPHFHLIVYTPVEAIPVVDAEWTFVNDAVSAWVGIARRPGDSEHYMRRYAVNARFLDSWRGVMAYASKTAEYLSKKETVQPVDEHGEVLPTGRIWGTLGNKSNLPVSYEYNKLNKKDFMTFRRVFRRLCRPKNRRWTRRSIPRSKITNQRVLVDYRAIGRLLEAYGYYRN